MWNTSKRCFCVWCGFRIKFIYTTYSHIRILYARKRNKSSVKLVYENRYTQSRVYGGGSGGYIRTKTNVAIISSLFSVSFLNVVMVWLYTMVVISYFYLCFVLKNECTLCMFFFCGRIYIWKYKWLNCSHSFRIVLLNVCSCMSIWMWNICVCENLYTIHSVELDKFPLGQSLISFDVYFTLKKNTLFDAIVVIKMFWKFD